MVRPDFDVIVVGGGAMGTATARNLAARGHTTLLLERSAFGHAEGSSGGPTRIFRFMYHLPGYARMALAARDAWEELQDAAGEPLLHVTGGLDIGEPALRRADVLRAIGVDVEHLRSEEARERWPDLRPPEGAAIEYQPDGGVLRAARTVQVQAGLAVAAGADVREATTAISITVAGDRAHVLTEGGDSVSGGAVVVSAGPWAGPLLRTAGLDLPLRPTLEQGTYFSLDGGGTAGLRATGPLPTIIDWSTDEAQPPYLVPDPFDSEKGHFKVGVHRAGPPTAADTRTFDPDPVRVARVESWVERHVKDAAPIGRTDTCLYTLTPDEDFILDRIGPVVVASPCSGHGFKFAPLFGRVIADLATGAKPAFSLEAFALDRPALRRAGPG